MTSIPCFRGALIGLLTGEAFGVPYDNLPQVELPSDPTWTGGGSHGRLPGTYGEAGGMSLATAASLLECGELRSEDMTRRWVDWWAEGRLASGGSAFDATATTVISLQAIAEGVDPNQAALSGDEARGGGALLRVLPAAFLPAKLHEARRVMLATRIAQLTQGHPDVLVACGIYTLALLDSCAGAILDAERLESIAARLQRVYRAQRLTKLSETLEEWLAGGFPRQAENTGFVMDLLGTAWSALSGVKSFEEALRSAVHPGGHVAHRAALVGGLAGARFGLNGIPGEWRRELRLDPPARELLNRLQVPANAGSTTRPRSD